MHASLGSTNHGTPMYFLSCSKNCYTEADFGILEFVLLKLFSFRVQDHRRKSDDLGQAKSTTDNNNAILYTGMSQLPPRFWQISGQSSFYSNFLWLTFSKLKMVNFCLSRAFNLYLCQKSAESLWFLNFFN